MPSLQYLIDHMCANFTAGLMTDLVREQVSRGSRSNETITQAIIDHDRSLDFASARTLVDAAVKVMMEAGVVVMRDDHLHLAP